MHQSASSGTAIEATSRSVVSKSRERPSTSPARARNATRRSAATRAVMSVTVAPTPTTSPAPSRIG